MTNPRTAWIVYSVLRLLFFAIPFALLYVLGIWPWLAAIFAALIGVSLSIIFLSRPRATASESIYDWRNRDRTADDIVEDEAVEEAEGTDAQPSEMNTFRNDADHTSANRPSAPDAERG